MDSWEKSQNIGRSLNPRLPVLTHQYSLREDQAMMMTSLYELLGRPERWNRRLQTLEYKGLAEDDLAHWIWILEAQSHDDKVDRLMANDRFKPIFVLMALLDTNEYFRKGSSLVRLYDYIAQTYCRPEDVIQTRALGGPLTKTLDNRRNMTPKHFSILLKRLVLHCLKSFPSSIVMISRLVIDYIRTLTNETSRTAYAGRCLVFNTALQIFRLPPASSPVAHSSHSWKAQKLLLGFSSQLPQPLTINNASYRAIRMVLLGLKKSDTEKMAAERHAKTWPPYIRRFDGVDELRDAEDFLSRSVRAGMLKRSEGYADETIDRALDTLGGFVPGKTVSIHHRAAPLRAWSSRLSSLNIFTEWAVKVRATRSAQEAWQRFHEPPLPGLKPNFQVYTEMFSKLYAAEIDESSPLVPGEAKETYPPYEANLTEYERERLRPCTPDELYEQMLRDGNRPIRHCLTLLIQHADSVERVSQILRDSALDKQAIFDLTTSSMPKRENLQQIPIPAFNAYLDLLCRLQPRRRWISGRSHQPNPEVIAKYEFVNRAIKLLTTRMTPQARRAALPWHTVMRVLTKTNLVLRPYVLQREDDVHALLINMRLFEAYKAIQGLHPTTFDCLARCALKVLRCGASNEKAQEAGRRVASLAIDTLKTTFWQLTTVYHAAGDSEASADASHTLVHELSAAHIQTYLEVLMEYGDIDEGARVIEWVLSTWGLGDVLQKARDPGHKQWDMLMQAFACFRAYTDESLDTELARELGDRFEALARRGGTWMWPSEEDVERYRHRREMKEDMARALGMPIT